MTAPKLTEAQRKYEYTCQRCGAWTESERVHRCLTPTQREALGQFTKFRRVELTGGAIANRSVIAALLRKGLLSEVKPVRFRKYYSLTDAGLAALRGDR